MDEALIPDWLPQHSRVFNIILRQGPMTTRSVATGLNMGGTSCANHIKQLVTWNMLEEVDRVREMGARRGALAPVYDVKGRQ